MKLEGRRANGVPFPVEASVRWVDADEKTQVLCAVRELRYGALVTEAQRYFDAAFDHSPIGMALFNSDGEYVRVNAAWRGADGAVRAAAARPPRSGVHAPRGPAGRRRRRLGDPQRRAATTHQTEQSASSARTARAPRPARFPPPVEQHIARGRRYGTAGAIVMLDLEGVKRVNDTLGHQAGDALIAGCGETLRDRLRESDLLARWGRRVRVLLPARSSRTRS